MDIKRSDVYVAVIATHQVAVCAELDRLGMIDRKEYVKFLLKQKELCDDIHNQYFCGEEPQKEA